MPELSQMSQRVASLLTERKQTVAVAESSTGGLISASLLSIPGASSYFVGGSVLYTMAARKSLLGITREQVQGLEPLTEPMAIRFAQLAREQLNTTWAVAELGAAGPTATRYGHAAGTSVIAVSGPVERALTIQTGQSGREDNMWRFSADALNLLLESVLASDDSNA